jgi:hypothetical protein
MKKKIVLLVILGFAAGNVLANNLLNPGFELGTLGRFGGPQNVTNWTTFGTKGWHTGNTGNDFAHSGTKGVKIWWDDTYIYQDISVTAGNRYDFSVWAYSFSGDDLGLRFADGVLQVKWYDAGSTLILEEEIGRFYGALAVGVPIDPYDTWKFISGTRTAPSQAVTCRVFMYLDRHEGAFEIKSSIFWDDASVNSSFGASNPLPADGAADLAPYQVTMLSWNKPAPRQSGDIVRCDVWFGTDANMPGTNTKILNKQDATSVAISSPASHKKYYWRVDCYDPVGSGPEIKSEGMTWTFNTVDNCASYMPGDVSGDCYVNFDDFVVMAESWFKCNDMSNSQCH